MAERLFIFGTRFEIPSRLRMGHYEWPRFLSLLPVSKT
jgi:hypothetical protein